MQAMSMGHQLMMHRDVCLNFQDASYMCIYACLYGSTRVDVYGTEIDDSTNRYINGLV